MRRQLIFVGVTMFVFLTLALISAATAAPERAPLFQINESEPNNSPAEANPISINTQVLGSITQSGTDVDTDYFSISTQAGMRYVADLTILSSPGMKLQIRTSDAGGLLGVSSSSNNSVQLTWDSQGGTNYIQIRKQDVPTMTVATSYQLEITLWSATATPSPSPTPDAWDGYEPNDSFTEVYTLPVGTSVELDNIHGDANFAPYESRPGPDEDWFAFYVQSGLRYEVYTTDLSDSDTFLSVYNRSDGSSPIATDDNGGGGFSSELEWQAAYTGYYYIRLTNNIGTTGSYNLVVAQVGADETSTPTATSTPRPGMDSAADGCENNFDFDHACVIPPDEAVTYNFTPPYPGTTDNDYFRIWVKTGLIYQCTTSNLSPGIDPNMIVFTGPSWDSAIGGNDDIEPGNFNSSFTFIATYEGWLYLLLGTGDRTPSDIYESDYTLRCSKNIPGQPTSTPGPARTATPVPGASPTPTSPASPLPTPTRTPEQTDELSVRLLTTPEPPPTPGTPALHFVPVDLLVYYDANDDRSPGAGEGVRGILIIAYDTATGEEIAQGFTDELGHLEFTVAVQGLVRVSVPYLGISHVVGEETTTVTIRVAPSGGP